MGFLVRRVWWLLLIDGALVLGFVMPYVFSVLINAIDMVATMILPAIMLLALATFGQKHIQWKALPATLLAATVFSLVFAFAGKPTNPLYAILCWLPIVLMYLLRLLDHPLIDRIRRGFGVLSLFLFFLGLGMGCGTWPTTMPALPLQIFPSVYIITFGQLYVLILAMFIILTLIGLASPPKQKKMRIPISKGVEMRKFDLEGVLKSQAVNLAMIGITTTWAATLWIMMLLTGRVPAQYLHVYLGSTLFFLGLTVFCFWGFWKRYITTSKRKTIFAIFLVIVICFSAYSHMIFSDTKT